MHDVPSCMYVAPRKRQRERERERGFVDGQTLALLPIRLRLKDNNIPGIKGRVYVNLCDGLIT